MIIEKQLSATASAFTIATTANTTVTITTRTTIAITTGTTIAITTGTTGAIATRAAGGFLLLIAFGFGQKSLTAELNLASLFVDIDNLHLELVTLFNQTFERLGTTPVVLADVHQALFAGQELEEGTKLDNADHLGIIHLSHLRNGANFLNPLDGGRDIVLVLRSDIDNTELANFFDVDDGIRFSLNLLDNLATLTDNSSDKVLRNLNLLDAGHKVFVILTGLSNGALDVVEDVETTLTSLLKCLGKDIVTKTINLDIHLTGGNTIAGTTNLEIHIA